MCTVFSDVVIFFQSYFPLQSLYQSAVAFASNASDGRIGKEAMMLQIIRGIK